ncbi:MAG: UvrB/UvrC motif-containing protein [Parachlamydiales bacterium]|jgi:protein arginine kinase activator
MTEKPPSEQQPEDILKNTPERPLECSECRRAIRVRYTEVIGDVLSSISMCSECPELEKRLRGNKGAAYATPLEGGTGLACGNCGTTLEAIRIGTLVGCSSCYEVFENVIIDELYRAQSIPPKLTSSKRTQMLHIGRAPGESKEMSLSVRIVALNEALNETLAREDYEQAALLRDQIRDLTEKKGNDNVQ